MNTSTSTIVKRMFFPVIVLSLGLVLSLLGPFFVFPVAVGLFVALAIRIFTKDSADKNFFAGLSLTFAISAVLLFSTGALSVYLV